MKARWKSIFFKIFKILGISIGSLLLILFILPYLIPNTISAKVKGWVNQTITSKLDFSEAGFSFFRHFPSLTFTLENVSITGSTPFANDTLIAGKELSFGVNLLSLFSNSVKINQVFLSDANINVQVDARGNANYNIYRSANNSNDTSSSSSGLKLENIVIENTKLTYNDLSVPLIITARNVNYKGSGDLSQEIFDLSTRLSADSFSLAYDGENYVNNKQLRAKLITAINTKSLSLIFEDNRILINKLPVRFSGSFDFLEHGYQMDLSVRSRKATLEHILSAIPPDMTEWMNNTKLGGEAVFDMQLKGRYDLSAHLRPDFKLGLKIQNGSIAYMNTRQPLKNIVLNMSLDLPSMDIDSLKIHIDSLYFTVGKGHFYMTSYLSGWNFPYIESNVTADIDLGAWNKAVGMKNLVLGGLFRINFRAKGKYLKGQNPDNWRKEIIVTSIPSFELSSSMHNGYIKFSSLPEAIQDISFNVNSSCTDGNYRHTEVNMNDIRLVALRNVFKGYFKLTDPGTPHIDAALSGDILLDDIEKLIPVKKLQLGGKMAIDIRTSGIYDSDKRIFPVTNANVSISDGKILTGYYPDPITRINVLAEVKNTDGRLSGTTIKIQPVSFEFEGQPFLVKADLSNPENVSYDIVSKGTLNLGKLYKVFGMEGFNVSGIINADVKLKGKQNDVMKGRYQLLDNSGDLQLRDIELTSELFPKPLMIRRGDFHFDQDKMLFRRFESSYGDMLFVVNGYLTNVVNYYLQTNGVLKGKLSFTSEKINLNEFKAFEKPEDDISRVGSDSSGSGVIMVPKNINLLFTAKVAQADYDSVSIKNFSGQVLVDSGKIHLQQTQFTLADATFKMDATYEGETPHKGVFTFKVDVDSFSIAKAYSDIPMFREMLTSASGVQGIVGMDYSLSGRLDQNMQPIYPSLTGGGVINLKKVKLKGFKLMNAVSQSTQRSELKDPDLSGINLKTTVKNNIITLEQVRLRVFGFRPRFQGQVSLDGDLNIKGRLGLPPFGIFGIPFTISGTSEDPVVKLKKDKSGRILQEKEDQPDEDQGASEPGPDATQKNY